MRVTMKHFADRLGRRGVALCITGALWIMFGIGVAAQPTERFSRPGPSPLDWMDNPLWGWGWIITGVIAIIVGVGRRFGPDHVGFGAAILMPIVWSNFYLYSFLVWVATAGQFGEPRRWQSFIVWIMIVAFIRLIAGWDDPSEPHIKSLKARRDQNGSKR